VADPTIITVSHKSLTAMKSSIAAALAALALPVQSLYFYMDGTTPKCFYEELPKDTMVVGKFGYQSV
jgi:hypothetical protein